MTTKVPGPGESTRVTPAASGDAANDVTVLADDELQLTFDAGAMRWRTAIDATWPLTVTVSPSARSASTARVLVGTPTRGVQGEEIAE